MRYLLPLGFCLGGLLGLALPALGSPTVTATPTAQSTALNLHGEGTTATEIVRVATVQLSTTNPAGLTLTVSVGNTGTLSKLDGRGSPISVQVVTVAANAAAPSHGDFSVPAGSDYTFVMGEGSQTRDLYLRYTPAALQDPGIYRSTISVSVVDND